MSGYTFISPIKANRDAVALKIKAKGGKTETYDTVMLHIHRQAVELGKDELEVIKEPDRVEYAALMDKELAEDEIAEEAGDIYIVEGDCKP
jgi:hypothetical protein